MGKKKAGGRGLWYNMFQNMNLEQREKLNSHINKLEGLLAWAIAHGEKEEAERLRQELAQLVEGL